MNGKWKWVLMSAGPLAWSWIIAYYDGTRWYVPGIDVSVESFKDMVMIGPELPLPPVMLISRKGVVE